MTTYTATASMLIRCMPQQAFDAFVDPDRITQFWLASTSGPLAPDAKVTWHFMVPGATETVAVTAFVPAGRIAFDWSDGLKVSLDFQAHGNAATRVTAQITGFMGADAADDVANATEGFSIVLCDLKTLIEQGRSANLVRDKARLIADAMSARSAGNAAPRD